MLSSIGVPMKMMLSFSSREKMSYARSPRLVCSTTIGTSWFRDSNEEGLIRLGLAGPDLSARILRSSGRAPACTVIIDR